MMKQPEGDPSLRLLVTSTSVYLVIPAILFAYGWLRLPYALVAIFSTILFVITAIKSMIPMVRHLRTQHGFNQELSRMAGLGVTMSGIIIAVWLLFSGVGGFGLQNPDYDASNALFHALVVGKWPVTMNVDGVTFCIVYYMAYFLPAALVGKMYGWIAANIAMFVWTAIGVVLAFVWFSVLTRVELLKKPSVTLWIALVFCLAGGLDFVAFYFVRHEILYITYHLETWAGLFQYSSDTALLYWVPQQAIAAWLLISLVTYAPGPMVARYIGMPLAAGLIWSPFAIVGLAPYLAIRLIFLWYRKELYVDRLTVLLCGAALFVGCIHALYIVSNQFKFPLGLLWNHMDLRTGWPLLVEFWLFEFGLLALLSILHLFHTAASAHRADKTITILGAIRRYSGFEGYDLAIVATSLAMLVLIPLLKIGYANDFSMRASIPSLFLFWSFVARIVVTPYVDEVERPRKVLGAILRGATLIVIMLGFVTSMNEISRSLRFYSFGPPPEDRISDPAEASEPFIVEQRMGNSNSFFYRYLGR